MKEKICITMDIDLLSELEIILMELETMDDDRTRSWLINNIIKTQLKNYYKEFIHGKANMRKC